MAPNNNEKANKVVISNTILKSDYLLQPTLELSLQQKRFIFYLISLVKKSDKDFTVQEISIADYCRLFGIESYSRRNPNGLKESLADLGKKFFWFKYTENGEDRDEYIRWLDKIGIDYKRGLIQVQLASGLKEFLLQLKNNYSSWELGYTAKFKSTHSFSLYHLFTKWLMNYKAKTFYITVEDLRKLLLQGNDRYSRWVDFKRRCIDQAIDEINEYTDYNVTYVASKKDENGVGSHNIATVWFTVTRKTGQELERASSWKNEDMNLSHYLEMIGENTKNKIIVDVPEFKDEGYEDILFDPVQEKPGTGNSR